ncbi:hypothetical protein [Streptomyces bicolor]|uniref:hypothetical protein n=1 Tax=Streptomyces bicolor TaxID=66874 RepID=UPI00068DE779|nr:hypothetical protein [Streptomyces bicolor]
MGATTYLEVVSTHRDQALASVRAATELGVDWLMGGTWIEETLNLLHGTSIGYLPFAGEPLGHPTRLAGSITSTDQVQALASAGADAFTIGSAALDGSPRPHAGALRSQLAPEMSL